MDVKIERKKKLKKLTNETGVYALCDLDRNPIYIGQSTDGIRTRVNRHLTSARSDVIANRQLDIWEICEVWAWPMPSSSKAEIDEVETYLIHLYNTQLPLVNGKIPAKTGLEPILPSKQSIPIMTDDERNLRLSSIRRLPRQLEHLNNLFNHILEVKNNAEQRRMLRVHYNRMSAYYEEFMKSSGEKEY